MSEGLNFKQHQTLNITTRTHFGIGVAAKVAEILRDGGYRKPAILIDKSLVNVPRIIETLKNWRAETALSFGKTYEITAQQEPTYDYLDKVAAEFRSETPDVLVGIGGGSALDLAKGVGVLLGNPGRGIDYRGMNKVKAPGVPVVLVPTTAGTGSEVTETASFIDSASRTKLGINGKHVGCLFSVLDPVLLLSCPASVTMSSGLDALVHAVEGVTTKAHNAISVLFGVEAVRLIFDSLAACVKDPENLEARAKTFLGSHYAGISMYNAGGGPASGISYPLGVYYSVPHGFAGGVLLPHVVAHNVKQGYHAGYARIYERLCSAKPLATDAEKAAAFRDAFFELYKNLGAPAYLGQWGVKREALDELTNLTMEQRKGNLDLNPVAFGREDVAQLIEAVTQ